MNERTQNKFKLAVLAVLNDSTYDPAPSLERFERLFKAAKKLSESIDQGKSVRISGKPQNEYERRLCAISISWTGSLSYQSRAWKQARQAA